MALFSEILSYGELVYRVTSNTSNLNIQTFIGTTAYQNKIRKKIIIESGVTISSDTILIAALYLPSGLGAPLSIVNNGSILAAGGQAGTVGSPNGMNGGTAISIASGNPIVYIDNKGTIYGGGGGGGLGNNGSNGVQSSRSVVQNFSPNYGSLASITLSHTYDGGPGGTGGAAGIGRGYNQSQTNGENGTFGLTGPYVSRSVEIFSNSYAFEKISIPAKTYISINLTGNASNYSSSVDNMIRSGVGITIGNPNDSLIGLKMGYGCTTFSSHIQVSNGDIASAGIRYLSSNTGSYRFASSNLQSNVEVLRKDPNQTYIEDQTYAVLEEQNINGGIVWGSGDEYPPDTHWPGNIISLGSSWVYTRDNNGILNGGLSNRIWYWPSFLPLAARGEDGGKGGNGGDWGQPGQDGGAGGAGGGGLGGLAGYYVDNSNVVWVSVGTRAGRTP